MENELREISRKIHEAAERIDYLLTKQIQHTDVARAEAMTGVEIHNWCPNTLRWDCTPDSCSGEAYTWDGLYYGGYIMGHPRNTDTSTAYYAFGENALIVHDRHDAEFLRTLVEVQYLAQGLD